jgi:hypothetical protein
MQALRCGIIERSPLGNLGGREMETSILAVASAILLQNRRDMDG